MTLSVLFKKDKEFWLAIEDIDLHNKSNTTAGK
jgi:hypothetical protein